MKFRVFLIILLLILCAAFWYISTGYFSSGERAGTLSKLSERGYLFKTYEGVLNEGGFSGETGTLQPRYWDFSANEDSVIVKLRTALNTGERVTLIYQEKFVRFPWNGDTKYFVTNVIFNQLPQKPNFLDQKALDAKESEMPEEDKIIQRDTVIIRDTVYIKSPV
ncbi:hypothetical protein LAG90_14635 [Marinilongibacter aquaticus]|uniref:hypothetical protein n=1 Tax=Marinilongibacter aquaticus TaxID=2975157 RepID=UPI0021BD7C67|nr:hypothetical protein [Marinilongibacter aquaticus]UBM58041.1 hypothetical protein LAG90_14635 [Marinilongibacter aquaticus]